MNIDFDAIRALQARAKAEGLTRHVPMSVQIEIMRRAEELGVSRVDVVLSALTSSGIVTELTM